jgi:hypothetical protein
MKLVVTSDDDWDDKKRAGQKKWQKLGDEGFFFQFLHPIFFMLRP